MIRGYTRLVYVCRLDIHIRICILYKHMFNTISARQIQREYKKVLQKANKSKEPIVVMANNKPLGAIIGLDLLEKIQLELLVKQALKESESGKTKVIKTSKDLNEDFKELEKYVSS